MDVDVLHEPGRKRFVAQTGGSVSQLVYMQRDEGRVDFRSTYVDPAMRGHGVGEKLVRAALDWARVEGLRVIPTCWFVGIMVRRHPEYRPLIEG